MILLFLGCIILAVLVYCAIAYWPPRIPPERTVAAIQRRVESERRRIRRPFGDNYDY